ncbi:hypothetical protein K3495_g492 [Podosphaera aphanis]|nr:hypothetical protein K3495_g492 [Podosphaera aphanis]
MADIPSHIECLKGQSSYRVWSVQIKSVLQNRGLWPYVLGKYEEPNEPEEGESKKDFNIQLRNFYIEKAKASGILQQSLSKDIILDVEFIEDPCDTWTFLKLNYEPSGLAHQTFNSEKDLPLLDDVISKLLDEDKAQKYNQSVNVARKEKLSQNQRLDENIYEAPSTDNEP